MIHYVVHGEADTVGAMTVDGKNGQSLAGWNMATDMMIRVANGRWICAEVMNHTEFVLTKLYVSA